MTDDVAPSTVIVVEDRTFEVSVVRRSLELMVLSVSDGNREEVIIEAAGWRPWACGVARGQLYVWTARQLITFSGSPLEAATLDVDEDLLFVFRTAYGWVLVCETSVRVADHGEVKARLEFDQVIELARWQRGILVIRDDTGFERSLVVSAEAVEEVQAR